MHSIQIDPRDADHMYIGMSSGGVFESRDKGKDWAPLNKGCAADFIPSPDPEYGHDPHNLQLHPTNPDRLYQQNHCGIYRMDRAEGKWTRIGERMPRKVGDIGFPIVLDPRDPDRVWVFPDGWDFGLAADEPGRSPGRLRDAQRGQDVEAVGFWFAGGERLVYGQTAGDGPGRPG